MTLTPLAWSDPAATGYASIKAEDEAGSRWRITPVPRDVARISFDGKDADGTIVGTIEHNAYAETADEAKIVIDVLRAGTDHLPGWREQLEAAGFVRTYPDKGEDEILSSLWHDIRKSGRFGISVLDGTQTQCRQGEIVAHATYESDGALSWHNVCSVNGSSTEAKQYGPLSIRHGLPEGVDPLKAGVAAAIAIRAARVARGGRFSTPLGGATKGR